MGSEGREIKVYVARTASSIGQAGLVKYLSRDSNDICRIDTKLLLPGAYAVVLTVEGKGSVVVDHFNKTNEFISASRVYEYNACALADHWL